MAEDVRGDDEVSRCLTFPTFFTERNIHANTKMFVFGARKPDGGSRASVFLRRLAPTVDEVHKIGCNIARLQNDRLQKSGKPYKRRYYVGCRTARVLDLPLIGSDYRIVLTVDGEGGVAAHTDVALYISDVVDPNAIAQTRTDVGLALAEQFGLTEGHTCPEDAEDQNHPIALGIPLNPDCDYPPIIEPDASKALE